MTQVRMGHLMGGKMFGGGKYIPDSLSARVDCRDWKSLPQALVYPPDTGFAWNETIRRDLTAWP